MTSPRDADLLDAALTRLHAFDTEYGDGMSNHGPMAAEALLNLGAPERIEPFLEGYEEALRAPSSAVTLPDGDWRRGLGRPAAAAALVEIFDRQLQQDDPRRVLARMLPELAPAVVSAAFHGLLRTGHAYRAWTQRDSAPRRTELAHGLAHWVSRFQQVPGQPGRRAVPGRGPAAALAAVPVLDPSERNGAGMIMDRFGVLTGRADFVNAVEAFDPQAVPPHGALDELISVAARLYLASRGRPQFVYLHGVTSTAALRLLLPVLPEPEQRRIVAHQVAALAAVHATHGEPGALERPFESSAVDPQAVARLATASDDDHTIKLVEASLREHRRSGRPELLAAAASRVGIDLG